MGCPNPPPFDIIQDIGTIKISGRVRHFVECRCHCGNTFNARKDHLKKGFIHSCGCTRWRKRPERPAYNAKPAGRSMARHVMNSYKNNAKRRGIVFDLTLDEFISVSAQNCYYCGDMPRASWSTVIDSGVGRGRKKANGAFLFSGVDRIDSSGPYRIGNVRPCCRTCNMAKGTKTEKEFVEWALRFFGHLPNWAKTDDSST